MWAELCWRSGGGGPSSSPAPPFRESDASPGCGPGTSGATGSSCGTPFLVRVGHVCICGAREHNGLPSHWGLIPKNIYTAMFPNRSKSIVSLLSLYCPFFMTFRLLSSPLPPPYPLPSCAAAGPVGHGVGGGWCVWLRGGHHRGTVCALDAAGCLLPLYEEPQRQAQRCETDRPPLHVPVLARCCLFAVHTMSFVVLFGQAALFTLV